jgi:nucleotide-binding universal stress UspA family protein
MTTILYPTRGGSSAYLNQDWAMSLAQERDASLLLLYVSNVHFLKHTAAPVRLDLVEAELEDLGEFLLAMAQERVEKAGFTAETAVRRGEFVNALEEIIAERDISVVVLGRPVEDTGITSEGYINTVASNLRDNSQVEVFVVSEGRVLNHLLPNEESESTEDGQ